MKNINLKSAVMILFLCVAGTNSYSQEKIMQLHRGGNVVHQAKVSEIDSITFADMPSQPAGVYIFGTATPWVEASTEGLMMPTKNMINQEIRSSLYECYVPMTTGTFQIKRKDNINIGGTLFMTYNGSGAYDHPRTSAYYYTPVQDGSFTIAKAGLYHVIYDTELNRVVVCEAKWGVRGMMNYWNFTYMNESADFKTFTVTDQKCNVGEYKFAYSAGWELGIDDTVVSSGGGAQVLVNTNFGGTISWSGTTGTPTLVAGGDNYKIEAANKGYYTITLSWNNGVWSGSMTKTGDIPAIDPATQMFSLIGSAFNNADGTPAAWDYDLDLAYTSTTDGFSSYVAQNVTLLTDGEFKVRKDHDWSTSYGYDAAKITGDASNFVDNYGNIKVVAGKTYTTITFKMHWETGAWEINFTL
ncbi:MAG: hypothetical protein LBQ31_07180 [Bacteroidales bacterium]|jgi:hypothetical protein|nr:hypothetical protein [Bacteroidales bacterium]